MAKTKNVTVLVLMRMRANWNTLTLPVSVYICTITLGKCVMISPKAKPTQRVHPVTHLWACTQDF